MNITIISVGKIKEKYIKLGIEEFSKRLSRYCKLTMVEVPDEKTPDNASEREMELIKDKEGKQILNKIKENKIKCLVINDFADIDKTKKRYRLFYLNFIFIWESI